MNVKKTILGAALCFMLLLPLACWSEDGAVGVLRPHGYVTVNGRQVTTTTTLFSGDVVNCGKDSLAQIVRSGSVIQVPGDSRASFHEGKFEVAKWKRGDDRDDRFWDKDRDRDHDDGDHDRDDRDHDRDKDNCRPISQHSPRHHHQHDHHNRCDKD